MVVVFDWPRVDSLVSTWVHRGVHLGPRGFTPARLTVVGYVRVRVGSLGCA